MRANAASTSFKSSAMPPCAPTACALDSNLCRRANNWSCRNESVISGIVTLRQNLGRAGSLVPARTRGPFPIRFACHSFWHKKIVERNPVLAFPKTCASGVLHLQRQRILLGWELESDPTLFAPNLENDVEVVLASGVGRGIKFHRRIGDFLPDGIVQIPRCQGYRARLDLALGIALGCT